MITLKQFMELVDYRITEGGEYGWTSFGLNAYSLSSWNGDHDGWSFSITFDTKYQTVYMVEACDFARDRAYRLIHPDCIKDYREEARERDIPVDEAWDNVNYVDLETDEDWLEKARAIVSGEDYDTRVSIPLNIPRDELLIIFQAAHERDITLNEFVEEALKEAIADFEQNPEEFKRKFNMPEIQSPPFPADNFTQEEAREAVRKAQKKLKKKNRG